MQQTITNQKTQTTNATQKLRRDKAKNALLETKVSLDIAAYEVNNLIDEFSKARTDSEKAHVLNRCIRYLTQNCMSNLGLAQLANCQSELLITEALANSKK
jgi:hypothetical protein